MIGDHHSHSAGTTTWLTPLSIIETLGPFAVDPCAAPPPRPWATAERMISLPEDGLSVEWDGRAWLNPPYSNAEIGLWMERMARHNHGTALIFARTETEAFQRHVWGAASGLMFLAGRLHFHYPFFDRPERCESEPHEWFVVAPPKKTRACRRCGLAEANSGAPSVFCAYGQEDMDRLAAANLPGAFVPLRFARFFAVAGLDLSWSQIMREWIARQPGPVSVSDAYRFFARHPKSKNNPNWRAKVRQKLMQVADRVAPNLYIHPMMKDLLA